MNAEPKYINWGRYQLKAGGFVFTEVWVENIQRILVRKDCFPVPSNIAQLEGPGSEFKATGCQEASVLEIAAESESESLPMSLYEKIVKWVNEETADAILIPNELPVRHLTLWDIQLRAKNYIRVKAEEEVRCYIAASKEAFRACTMPMKLNTNVHPDGLLENDSSKVEKHLIQLAGVYAVAKAALTPEEVASGQSYIFLRTYLIKNNELLKIIQDIFGYSRLHTQEECMEECQKISSRFSGSAADSNLTNTLMHDTLVNAITNCSMAFKFEHEKEMLDLVPLPIRA